MTIGESSGHGQSLSVSAMLEIYLHKILSTEGFTGSTFSGRFAGDVGSTTSPPLTGYYGLLGHDFLRCVFALQHEAQHFQFFSVENVHFFKAKWLRVKSI